MAPLSDTDPGPHAVLCPLDGSIVTERDTFGLDYLVRHSCEPVNMINAFLMGSMERIITDQTIFL